MSDFVNSYERNQIQIVQLNKKISELQTTFDEGFEMFSPIAGGERNFNNQEIKNLQMKMYLYADENKELQQKINLIKEEMKILKKIYRKSKADKKNTDDNKNMIAKLESCIKYCDTDVHRVKIELENIVDSLKND